MKFTKKVLANGLTILHEKRDVPVTTVMLGVRYGSAYENEEEKGIAHFIEHLCFKGTEKRTTKEIAESLEKVGGTLNAFTSEEVTAYHVKLPSRHLELAMDVIFDIFFNPIFPEEEVNKEANVICEEIRMYHDDPRAHVLEQIKKNLYKKPFGMFAAGTEENVRGMTRKQLLEGHRKIYFPGNSILVVVGNNSFEEIEKLAEKFCVERKGELKEVPKIESLNLKGTEKRQGIQQVNLAIGFHFPYEEKKYSGEVFSTIFGGGMSSRLFTEVREKRGLVYTVKSYLGVGKNYGYLIIFAGTDKSKTDEVIKICLEEFEKMKNLTEKELGEAKEQIIGNYYVEAEGSNETAVNLISEEIFGDAKAYYKLEENINNVSLKDIKELSKKTDYSYFILTP